MPTKSAKPRGGHNYITIAILMSLAILLLMLACVLWIARQPSPNAAAADIYQNGRLLQSIPLAAGEAPFSFTVTGPGGCFNEITVSDGGIGISSASCPDKLCVRQGYIQSSLLPIVCLPNGLVIQVREAGKEESLHGDLITPDIVTY